MFRDPRLAGSLPALLVRLDDEHLVSRWGSLEPDLSGLQSADKLLDRWRDPDHEYEVVAALVRLAAARDGQGETALQLVLHLLGPAIRHLAAQLDDLGHGVLDLVLAEMAAAIWRYGLNARRDSVIHGLRKEARKRALAELKPGNRYQPQVAPVLAPDWLLQWWLDNQSYEQWRAADVQLEDVLVWAAGRGVPADELGLLLESERERDRYRSSADDRLASRLGITRRTLLRRRQRTLDALRALAPEYLADVA